MKETIHYKSGDTYAKSTTTNLISELQQFGGKFGHTTDIARVEIRQESFQHLTRNIQNVHPLVLALLHLLVGEHRRKHRGSHRENKSVGWNLLAIQSGAQCDIAEARIRSKAGQLIAQLLSVDTVHWTAELGITGGKGCLYLTSRYKVVDSLSKSSRFQPILLILSREISV